MDGRRKSLTSRSASLQKKEKGETFVVISLFCFQFQSNKASTHTLRMAFKKEITARDEKKKETSWLGSVTVYTTHFVRAGLVFPAPVLILPVFGLPLQKVRARVKFWSGTGEIWYGKVIYIAKFYPSRATFFGTRTIFIRAVPKISCSVNGPFVSATCRTEVGRHEGSCSGDM